MSSNLLTRDEIDALFEGMKEGQAGLDGEESSGPAPGPHRPSVRKSERIPLFRHVFLHPDEELRPERAEVSTTLNVSKTGCFLVSFADWGDRSCAWLTIPELDDQPPVRVDIKWRSVWGESAVVPGVGVAFPVDDRGEPEEVWALLVRA